jgi:hypothetical protein
LFRWTAVSTNHVSVALPPDMVAVNGCDCEVVTAARRGERETVMAPGSGGGGGGEVAEFPAPQEISPKEKSAEDANAKSWIEYFGRQKDNKRSRNVDIIRISPERGIERTKGR